MKRNHSETDLQPVKKEKLEPELPAEVWSLIFSLLPFDDQVNCRLVCKAWLDLVSTLPAFRNKNCLNLKYATLAENDPPVTTILNSKLQFGSLTIGKMTLIQPFPGLSTFFARIGETVTYLDISNTVRELEFVDGSFLNDAYRFIVENLNLFKVLHHINVGSVCDWLCTAKYTSPGEEVVKEMIEWIFSDESEHLYTYDMIKSFFESRSFDIFQQNLFLQRHKDLILEKIKKHLDSLNNERQLKAIYIFEKIVVETIVTEIETAIEEADDLIDLSSRANNNVRVITIEPSEGSSIEQNMYKMLKYFPNVQEINFHFDYSFTKPFELLKKFPDRITSVRVFEENLQSYEKLRLPKLKHITIGQAYIKTPNTRNEMLNRCIDLFPHIKSVAFYTDQLPEKHFLFITELKLRLKSADQLSLTNLAEFRNLHTLKIAAGDDWTDKCFLSHQPVELASIKKLSVKSYVCTCCLQCFEAMLQSLPNLRELKFKNDTTGIYADKIFKHQRNLEILEIIGDINDRGFTFVPKNEWPEMKKLRVLKLEYAKIEGDEATWDSFGKKFKKLKYFQVEFRESPNLLHCIGSNMPELQRVGILVYNDKIVKYYSKSRPLITKYLVYNGRKFTVDKFYYGPKNYFLWNN